MAQPLLVLVRENLVMLHMLSDDVPANPDEMSNYMILASRFASLHRKAAILVHRVGTRDYYIMEIRLRGAMSDSMRIVTQTSANGSFIPGTNIEGLIHTEDEPIYRPRNSFILYRRWMSDRILEENPGIMAASISQVVSNMWRSEEPEVKAYFRALAFEEERRHRAAYPQYHYVAGLRVAHAPLSKEDAVHDPMEVARRLIVNGS